MRSALILVVLASMLMPKALHAADYCDDKIEPGESPDGKAMVMLGSMLSVALAERYCGAPPTPPSQIFVVVEEGHGCGPRARLEAEYKKRMEGAEVMTTDDLIRNLAFDDEKDIPQAEMDRRAKAAIEGELGGCSELLKMQQQFLESYRNPPKWPHEPEK
ncbi:hypothetical protein FJV76_28490 [Mesorhizobium sp. WSM4303]|uniref:hypothetical protein n=1 Tax=unclassified Mesorhizobium TaxID=325217 RepID=UPI00115CF9DD|nr:MULTISPECIES: hypothetical protein [unclassified Mesorhizobium]TRC89942.1 hypothetical protein FJV77_29025 [Mesorhizobium sp. WSM4306]TRC96301.1 hypothetical protein FJV76_28490 [Mesorhizobium sp. WSM4303]